MYTWMVGQVETSKKQDVPDRTGNGDAIAGVANPFTAMGSSSSSSGDIVSSDCMAVNDVHGEGVGNVPVVSSSACDQKTCAAH